MGGGLKKMLNNVAERWAGECPDVVVKTTSTMTKRPASEGEPRRMKKLKNPNAKTGTWSVCGLKAQHVVPLRSKFS
jgi:hypothetical protein